MPHAYFRNSIDRYAAEVFSEVLEPGAFKYSQDLRGTPFGPEADFPPEPSHLTSMTAAFIAQDGVSVRRFSMHEISGRKYAPTQQHLTAVYAGDVSTLQRRARQLEPIAHGFGLAPYDGRFGQLGGWAVDTAQKAGLRLIAAHVVYRAVSGRIYSAFAYPTAVYEAFPLLIRNALGPLVVVLQRQDEDAPRLGNIPKAIRTYLEQVMRNEEQVRIVAGIPPAAVMPPIANFRAATAAVP